MDRRARHRVTTQGGGGVRLSLMVAALLMGCATSAPSSSWLLAEATGGSGNPLEQAHACGAEAVPTEWPDFSSSARELLAPFLACASPAEFLALQQRVDMARVVEALDDWHAVRLGAQGPVREEAASSRCWM